jgi:hypothetical protein
LTTDNREVLVETGAFLKTVEEVGNVVVGVFSGRAGLFEGGGCGEGRWGEEPANYVFHGFGAGAEAKAEGSKAGPLEEVAVTLSVAKRPGANAICGGGRGVEEGGIAEGQDHSA